MEVSRDEDAYAQGFYDAQDLEPLFEDAHEDYVLGWKAYWACKKLYGCIAAIRPCA